MIPNVHIKEKIKAAELSQKEGPPKQLVAMASCLTVCEFDWLRSTTEREADGRIRGVVESILMVFLCFCNSVSAGRPEN